VASTPASERAAPGSSAHLGEAEAIAGRLFADDEQKVNAGKELRELITHPGWQHMRRAWGLMHQREIDKMTIGVHDHAKYAQFAGRIHGLRLAADMAADLVSVAERVRDRRDKEAQEAQ
jgi:hypothetical protein